MEQLMFGNFVGKAVGQAGGVAHLAYAGAKVDRGDTWKVSRNAEKILFPDRVAVLFVSVSLSVKIPGVNQFLVEGP